MQEFRTDIKQTIGGYEVKNVYFKKLDNIYVGQVKDPLWGKENLFEGYITVTWNAKGVITRAFKEKNGNIERTDLTIKLEV